MNIEVKNVKGHLHNIVNAALANNVNLPALTGDGTVRTVINL